MQRFGGHFGLAYPFLIPMTMWWVLRKNQHPRIEKGDILIFLTLTFFTFNNPYVGFTASGFLLCAGFILFMMGIRRAENRKKAFLIAGMGLLANLVPYITFYFADPVQDRIQQQWGFFYYNATLKGLLFPQGSFFYDLLHWAHAGVKELEFETCINIGLVLVGLLGTILTLSILGFFRKKKWPDAPFFRKENLLLFGAAFLLFLYAANRSLLPLNVKWMEDHLGPLLMFKASARIGWPIYFAIAVSGVLCLDWILKKIKSPLLVYGVVGLLSIIWILEIRQYVGIRYQESFHANFLHRDKKKEILDFLQEKNIDITQYQAILSVPKMMAWNDNFISEINWATQFYSMRISAATGLPMISAMLSRISNSRCAEAIQMLSHPLIKRDLLSKLPNEKDILLVVGGGHPPLAAGEQYVIDIAQPLFTSTDYSLYRLSLDSLVNNKYIQSAYDQYLRDSLDNKEMIHLSFDSLPGHQHFYGSGAKLVPKGQTVLIDQPLPVSQDSQFVFSAWTKIENKRHGVGQWYVSVTDSTRQPIFETRIETRRSNDVQDLWIRGEVVVPAPKGSRIWAMIDSEHDLYVDEILIYPLSASPIIDIGSKDVPEANSFLYKGYKVIK
jgi:hypothetical protein